MLLAVLPTVNSNEEKFFVIESEGTAWVAGRAVPVSMGGPTS